MKFYSKIFTRKCIWKCRLKILAILSRTQCVNLSIWQWGYDVIILRWSLRDNAQIPSLLCVFSNPVNFRQKALIPEVACVITENCVFWSRNKKVGVNKRALVHRILHGELKNFNKLEIQWIIIINVYKLQCKNRCSVNVFINAFHEAIY